MAASPVQLPASFQPTHDTAGLSGYPAKDIFAAPGTAVLAPASGTLVRSHMIPWNMKERVGGWTTYLVTPNGTYFLTHMSDVLKSGTKVQAGEQIGHVAPVPGRAWQPHVHEGFHAGQDKGISSHPTPTQGDGGTPNPPDPTQTQGLSGAPASSPPDPFLTHPMITDPGSTPIPAGAADALWKQIAAQVGASSDTLYYANNAALANGLPG